MRDLATAPGSATDDEAPRRSVARGTRDVVLLSLAVTAFAALAALVPALAFGVRWSLAFVYIRWSLVFVLLSLPLAHQLLVRLGVAWQLPWGLRTPATALLLTCEGIAYDIISAQLSS
jgi:hypothetical protein